MKKYLFIPMMALMPFIAVLPVHATIIDSGTTTFNFFGGGGSTTTVDWAVYSAGTDPFGATGTGNVYAYTLNGWSGYTSTAQLDIFNGFGVLNGAGNTSSAGVTATVGQNPPAPAGSAFGVMSGSLTGGTFGAGSNTSFWWTSSMGPKTTTASLSNGIESLIGVGRIVAPDAVSGPPPPSPGVPEPQTWALLLTLMGFTSWWMRRKQDDNAPLENAIAA